MQDYTAMATLVRAFEQARAERMTGELPDTFAVALLDMARTADLAGATCSVDLRSPLGRRAHRLGLLVRRQRG